VTDSKSIIIENHTIELTHLNKILFPQTKITKEDIINYYKDIAPYALPLYKDRPLTMLRCPNGIDQQTFMQKEAPSYLPEWIERHKVAKKGGYVTHILMNDQATFVYLANQACISFHLALSTIEKINYPRYLLFDIDPSTPDLVMLKRVLKRVKELLDDIALRGYLQTTGSRGFHVYVPLNREHEFDFVHEFGKKFATVLANEYPYEITIDQSKATRGERVFIDYARNSYGFNVIAPYSVRTKENAPVATPIYWDEIAEKKLASQAYHIKNIFQRLKEGLNPWEELSDMGFSLVKANEKLSKLV
jgi:bifunctional non-homologous end joining protein LigD